MATAPAHTVVGSKAWLDSKIEFFNQWRGLADRDCRHCARTWRALKKNKAWIQAGYETADEFARKELNATERWCDTIELGDRLVDDGQPLPEAEAKELVRKAKDQAETIKQGQRTDLILHSNSMKSSQGTTRPYLLRRLARDHPDILKRFERGEFTKSNGRPSVRAAALAAGIVKVPTGLELLTRAWNKASEDERDTFLCNIGQQVP